MCTASTCAPAQTLSLHVFKHGSKRKALDSLKNRPLQGAQAVWGLRYPVSPSPANRAPNDQPKHLPCNLVCSTSIAHPLPAWLTPRINPGPPFTHHLSAVGAKGTVSLVPCGFSAPCGTSTLTVGLDTRLAPRSHTTLGILVSPNIHAIVLPSGGIRLLLY